MGFYSITYTSESDFNVLNPERLKLAAIKYHKGSKRSGLPEEEEKFLEFLREFVDSFMLRKHPRDFSMAKSMERHRYEIDKWFLEQVSNEEA